MPERPILLFSEKFRAERAKRSGGNDNIKFPNKARQINRLSPKFSSLQTALNNGNLALQNAPNTIEPEYTLVFEVAGSVDAFYTTINCLNDGAQKKYTQGGYAEIIFDLPDRLDVNDDFYDLDKSGTRTNKTSIPSKLYCVSTNGRALQELLSLWNLYTTDEDFKFPIGKAGLRAVFEQLNDIRQWGVQERLEETGVLEDWNEMLPYTGNQGIKCEIELFYSKDPIKQQTRERIVSQLVNEQQGRVISKCLIDEINYHSLLIELPRKCIEKIIERQEIALVQSEQIMFFHSTGQHVVSAGDSFEGSHVPTAMTQLIDEPVIALFDGLPQENHPYLQNILMVDDPDNYAQNYIASIRNHGTSMASLIAHGDLNHNTYTTTRKIYVRPIMKAITDFNGELNESVPDDILLVDKIHIAVRRLFENVNGEAVAPQVKVINFSIGDLNRVFINAISPLARLLDWLSYKYNVLFIISAGNHYYDFNLDESFETFASKNITDRSKSLMKYVNGESHLHRLLSPAESINSLTVGALFADFTTFTESAQQILPCDSILVDPASATGKGVNKSVKPDIVYYGGRNTIRKTISTTNSAKWRFPHSYEPGILSAAPGTIGTKKESYSSGTSNATALITHEAAKCYDIIDSLVANGCEIDGNYYALLIKAMLAHGAEWNENIFEAYASLLDDRRKASDTVFKYFGYGFPDMERAQTCTKKRATLLGFGSLKDGEADVFSLPLPFDFARNKIFRRLTLTLASFVPTITNRQKYRATQIWATLEGAKSKWNRKDIDWQAALRGTLQHEIFENNKTEVWGEDDCLSIKVNCRNDADSKCILPVQYALMVSFEIKEDIDIDVYERIADKVRPRVAPNP